MATAPEPASGSTDLLRFGIFELDTEAGRLYKDGRFVRLQPKPFKLLCLLAENGGKVVTREEIQKTLWASDPLVDFEQSVNFAMRQVHEALGENPDRPLYIQTVPKRGFRLLAPVERVAKPEEADDPIFRPPTDGRLNKLLWTHVTDQKLIEEQRLARRALAMKAAAAAFLLALIAVFLLLR
jgi:DNA-binding winged helix-turn-helix (wHTH) protein